MMFACVIYVCNACTYNIHNIYRLEWCSDELTANSLNCYPRAKEFFVIFIFFYIYRRCLVPVNQ